jgi:hypothetical protein
MLGEHGFVLRTGMNGRGFRLAAWCQPICDTLYFW